MNGVHVSHCPFKSNPKNPLIWEQMSLQLGLDSSDIIILDAITAAQAAVLSGHESWVMSVAFSPDGESLVSGSYDKTVKLWICRLGVLSRPSMAILVGFFLSPSPQIAPNCFWILWLHNSFVGHSDRRIQTFINRRVLWSHTCFSPITLEPYIHIQKQSPGVGHQWSQD